MGLATGTLFLRPVAAFFSGTSITWDAQNCPAGIYTISALAHTQSTTKTYSVTSRDVSLPAASVVQQFSDLPVGVYQVSATVIGSNGRSFGSEMQTVNGQGGGGGGGGATILGQSHAPARVPAGFARARNAPAPPPRPPEDPPRKVTPPVDDTATRAAVAVSRKPSRPMIDDVTNDPLLQRLLARLELTSGLDASDQIWRQVTVVDTDGDGTLDIIAIESATGETWVFHIKR
jgi:hypothetical protein